MSFGITVAVGETSELSDKMGKYISYKITSESTKSGFRPGSFVVDRRYSDFSWLQQALGRELPGTILPPLPDKQTLGRFDTEFITQRRRALERFLLRIVSHPDLSASHLLVIFLQSDEGAFARAKEDAKHSRPKITSSAVTWLEGKVNTIAYGKADLERTTADARLDEILEYVGKTEKLLQVVVKHGELSLKRYKETANSVFDLGQALSNFGQSEGDSVGIDTAQLGATIERSSNGLLTLAEAETSSFLEPFDDYLRLMGSIKGAIQQRQEKRQAYILAMTDVDAKGAALRKAQSSQPGKDISSKETALKSAEAVRDATKADYERVTDRVLQEYELFKDQKAGDIKLMVSRYVEVHMDYHRRVESIWEEVAPRLQAQDVGQDSAGQVGAAFRGSVGKAASIAASSSNPFGGPSSYAGGYEGRGPSMSYPVVPPPPAPGTGYHTGHSSGLDGKMTPPPPIPEDD